MPKIPVVCDIESAYTVAAVKGQSQEMVNRLNYGISLCENGRIEYTHKGKKTVSVPDCAVLIPCGESYHIDKMESGNFPLVNFCSENRDIREFVTFPVSDFDAAFAVYNDLRAALDNGNKLLAVSHLYRLFAMLCNPPAVSPVEETVAYMAEHYGDVGLNNEKLARRVHISEIYLRRLFKNYTGKPPHKYLCDLRIREACRLLEETRFSIGEIAEKCGFSGVYHFSRCFRQTVGKSPTDYRAHIKSRSNVI